MSDIKNLEKKVKNTNMGWFLKSRRWQQLTDDIWMDPVDNTLKNNIEDALRIEVKRHARNDV